MSALVDRRGDCGVGESGEVGGRESELQEELARSWVAVSVVAVVDGASVAVAAAVVACVSVA